eukprot:scaffold277978_cov32-Attheya_sp.AAC.1
MGNTNDKPSESRNDSGDATKEEDLNECKINNAGDATKEDTELGHSRMSHETDQDLKVINMIIENFAWALLLVSSSEEEPE